jgi:hypothetical protein
METTTPNILMQKLKLPGRTFQLPSRGVLYHNGEISSKEGEVHIHPMSALTEISLKNPDMLFNGKALEEVFAECVPEVKKPLELLGRDIDALMFYLRLVTYGPAYEISVKHTCPEAKQHSYTVDIEQEVMTMKQLDPTLLDQFSTTLQNGQVVRCRPASYTHMIKLFQLNAGKTELSNDDMKENITFNLVQLIESVDGVTDKSNIEEWVKSITTLMQNRITDVIEKMNDWGPSSTVKVKCRDCGEEMRVELPLNPVSFFTE